MGEVCKRNAPHLVKAVGDFFGKFSKLVIVREMCPARTAGFKTTSSLVEGGRYRQQRVTLKARARHTSGRSRDSTIDTPSVRMARLRAGDWWWTQKLNCKR